MHTTALAHEAWIKLLRKTGAERGGTRKGDRGPVHFGTVVAIMRAIIIDEARSEGTAKRGEGWRRISLSEADEGTEPGLDVLDIEEALVALERSHPRAARVLELRVFGGLGKSQTAALLSLSEGMVASELRFARAILRARLDPR